MSDYDIQIVRADLERDVKDLRRELDSYFYDTESKLDSIKSDYERLINRLYERVRELVPPENDDSKDEMPGA